MFMCNLFAMQTYLYNYLCCDKPLKVRQLTGPLKDPIVLVGLHVKYISVPYTRGTYRGTANKKHSILTTLQRSDQVRDGILQLNDCTSLSETRSLPSSMA